MWDDSHGRARFHSREGREKMKESESGFTIVELLMVVAIIGILAAMALSNFNLFKSNAKNARAASDARGIAPSADVASTQASSSGSPSLPLPAILTLDGTGGDISELPGARYSPETFGTIDLDTNRYVIKTYQLGGDVCYTMDNGRMSAAVGPCT
jgi:type IV pilus assembly protein PilA